MAKIIGISGSTVKSGVLEKAMEHVLKATGHEWETVRLQTIDMKQCTGCVGCASTNQCVIKDDINGLLDKILEADAIVMGGVTRFGTLNALTRMFFERMFPLFHRKILTEGKLVASVVVGLFNQEDTKVAMSDFYQTYKMEEIGALILDGNASCYKCGFGETCGQSAFRAKFGDDAKITKDVFYGFDKDKEAVERATLFGEKIAQAL